MVSLVIYGDFNCPYSALASARAAELERRTMAEVDWRAVEHDTSISSPGEVIAGSRREELERELTEIRGVLAVGVADRLHLPAKRFNSRRANEMLAAVPVPDRPVLRERLFSAYWVDGQDLTDTRLVETIGSVRRDARTAETWRDEWLALPQQTVPALVRPGADFSFGLDALEDLDHLIRRGSAKPDLDTRSEIHDLVVHFYRGVVFDELLGPVFGEVAEVDWSAHIPKLVDYWCRVLLDHPGYDGYILGPHQHVHELQTFTLELFDRWYLLFVAAVDEGWQGPMAEKAKTHAARIAAMLARRLLGAAWEVPARAGMRRGSVPSGG